MNIAREFAHVDELTLEALPREERERYERYADAVEDWLHDLDSEIHAGCHPGDALFEEQERGREEGFEEACVRILHGIERMRRGGRGRWSDGTLYDVERRILAIRNAGDRAEEAA